MTSEREQDKITAVQAVVDRVSSWQESATEGTVEAEIRKGLGEVGVDLDDDQVTRLAQAIEDKGGATDAGEVLA